MRVKCRVILSVLVLATLVGCRREDVREMTLELPGLCETNQAAIVSAITKYEGVDKTSLKWDLAAKTLTLKYDSMKVAQSNIRYAIDEKGIAVKFPVKEGDHAGY